eukprot:scaffold5328_cov19-Tisochrysis_lutea.AAC.1
MSARHPSVLKPQCLLCRSAWVKLGRTAGLVCEQSAGRVQYWNCNSRCAGAPEYVLSWPLPTSDPSALNRDFCYAGAPGQMLGRTAGLTGPWAAGPGSACTFKGTADWLAGGGAH